MSKVLDNRYKLLKVLGKGGFGRTYLARDQRRPGAPLCVVKQLKPASNDPEFIREARRLFAAEAETLERLGKHDQIPQLLAYFEEDNDFFLVQEYIDGTPLNKDLEAPLPSEGEEITAADIVLSAQAQPRGRQLSETEVIKILKDILNVLEFVHAENVIHRDIKPENLIRRHSDNKLVLIDFGAVRAMTDENAKLEVVDGQSRFTVTIGTPGYMPSEQCAGRPNYTSDIYAAGMVAIRALTGIDPQDLPTDPETGEVVWRDKAKVSNGLAMVLSRMVRYRFTERYQSVKEVQQALNAFLIAPDTKPVITGRSRATTARPKTTITKAQVQSSAGAGLLIIGLLCIVAAIGFLVLGRTSTQKEVLVIKEDKPQPAPEPVKKTANPSATSEVQIIENSVNLVDDQETQLQGNILKGQVVHYKFTAKPEQRFKLKAMGDGIVVNLLAPGAALLKSNISTYDDLLTRGGEYIVEIKPTLNQSSYSLQLLLAAPPAEVERVIQVR
ncbi:MAG: serine/threonine-protein kinase [Pseudanabaenaceae cyanobacterium SKYGB_i_bin29]|nr:serine/threonine protein kinase [Pseudanabaenaceae cyanobacterium SKYG29]MDW8421796.1 serine/threonine-protein kinase [Pseudanabaenaceae cyanobacterium SKYGB_i_bin29]